RAGPVGRGHAVDERPRVGRLSRRALPGNANALHEQLHGRGDSRPKRAGDAPPAAAQAIHRGGARRRDRDHFGSQCNVRRWLVIVLLAVVLALRGSPDTAVVRDIPVGVGETLRITSTGSGRPVVLLPGLFGAAFGYRKIVGPMAELGYRTIVIEPLGFGWSSHPRRANYSLSAQTARVAAVLDSLGLHKALIIAHSTGGSIALRLAYQRPDLVEGILSIDGGPSES